MASLVELAQCPGRLYAWSVTTLGDSRPTYLQVADELRNEITSGRLQPGARLPSVRDLSARFEIAAVTTQNALRVLREEGLVVSRSTRGYFVRDELPEQPAPSPEYLALREQLGTIQATVEHLAQRVSHLEEAAHQARAARPGRRPARGRGSGEPAPPSVS
jgi:DNA-binding transcriptional regulator YhcF (GntR family)